MSEEPTRPSRLDESPRPTAIVHEGFFVYANQVFLKRLGYQTLEELQAVPLLDMVDEQSHARLREHLEAAKRSAGTDQSHPEAKIALIRADDLPLQATWTSHRTRHGGEDCVQIHLYCPGDSGVLQQIKELPWRHYLSILFLLLFTVLPSTLLLKLNIDNSPTVYFPDDEPAVVVDRTLRERFPNDQVFVLLFEGVALFSDGFLEAYDALGQDLLQMEAIDDVVGVTMQDHIAGTQDEFFVERLIDTGEFPDPLPAERQERAQTDRFSRRLLTSEQGDALAMVVIPAEAGNSIERLGMEEMILAAVQERGLEGYLTAIAGQIPVDVAQLRSMLSDNMVFIPATVTIGLALIWWLFRRKLAVMLAGIAIGVVVNSTMAFYVILDQPFTLVSSITPPLLSALTIAALVHLFNALLLKSRRGLSGAERVSESLAAVNRPALFAAVTTAAGLASLAASDIVPIRTFGLISAIGTLFIYVVVFKVLPNVIARWDRSAWSEVQGNRHFVDRVVAALYTTGIRYPLAVLLISGLILAAGIPQLGSIVVETNLQEFFDHDHPIREDTRHIDQRLVGTMPLSVVIDADALDGLKDPAKLALVRDFQAWVTDMPEVDKTLSMVDFIEEMNWGFNAEDPAFRKLPDNPELISQYLLIYDGEDLYDFVDRDFQHSHVTLNLNVHSANRISTVIERIRNFLENQIGTQLHWDIAGIGRLFADMEDLLVSGQVYSLWGALLLIFVLMLLLMRSLSAAIICMIPNLSPIFLIFVIMGATGIWLDMATAMIASVAIGIAVDDTIHVYHGFHYRVRAGIPATVALARTYRHAGRAVVVTTIILSAQFLILMLSDFVPTRNFGVLTAVGLVTALVFDLLLLPALLIALYGDESPLRVLRRLVKDRADEGAAKPDAGFDTAYWTTQRKTALVRELLSGRHDKRSAAQEYELPESEIDKWLTTAERGIVEALEYHHSGSRITEPQKLRALAKAYKRLEAENAALRRTAAKP